MVSGIFAAWWFIAVGALKATGIHTLRIKPLKFSRHGGGALGARMNLFDRLARVVKVGFTFQQNLLLQ